MTDLRQIGQRSGRAATLALALALLTAGALIWVLPATAQSPPPPRFSDIRKRNP